MALSQSIRTSSGPRRKWYAIYRADGTLASSGSSIAPVLPAGMASKSYPEKPTGLLWNPATLDFDLPEPAAVRVISASAFFQRFLDVEYGAIKTAIAAGDMRASYFFDLLFLSQTVTLGVPAIVQGLDYLEQAGLIAAGRAAVIGG